MLSNPTPASVNMALRFSITMVASSVMPVVMISPVFGLDGIWPETKSKPFAATAWLYGPIGAGALLVLMIVFIAGVMLVYGYFFRTNHWMSFQMMPSRNILIAMALITCITLRLKLVGLFGSFFLKKYITQI